MPSLTLVTNRHTTGQNSAQTSSESLTLVLYEFKAVALKQLRNEICPIKMAQNFHGQNPIIQIWLHLMSKSYQSTVLYEIKLPIIRSNVVKISVSEKKILD
jgi:hypothetical protein